MGGDFPEWSDRIQGGFALRAWLLLDQYLAELPRKRTEEQYEATLTVCVLQALLTNTVEFMRDSQFPSRKLAFDGTVSSVANEWGLSSSLIKDTSFPTPMTVGALLIHLRNALSHPTFSKSRNRVTGYTTEKTASRTIAKFVLTSSPWIKDGAPMEAYQPSTEKAIKKIIRQFESRHGEVPLQALPRPDSTFEVGKDGQPYLPFIVMELSLQQMIDLAKHLATYLVQQAIGSDEGQSIEELALLDSDKKRLLYVV